MQGTNSVADHFHHPASRSSSKIFIKFIRWHILISFAGIHMLTILVPLLISYLIEPHEWKSSSKYSQQLHEHSLAWLKKIGPKYPQEFKGLMAQSTDLRGKLEAAIRNSQELATKQQRLKSEQQNIERNINAPAKPAIELKTNFNNFA